MEFLRRLFSKKKEKPLMEILNEIKIGDLVYVEYKHPKEIGLLTPGTLTHTRLNREEIEKRNFRGTVSMVRKENTVGLLLEITTFESPAMVGFPRKFLFLSDEISKIKILQ